MNYLPHTWRIVEANICLEEGWVRGDLWVKEGRITAIGRLPGHAYGPLYHAKGAYLLPGLIDTHVHFREPGFPHKGTFYTESRAAVASGVTTVFDMPNTEPSTTTLPRLREKKIRIARRAWTNYALYFGATSDNLSEIVQLSPREVAGLKVFLASSTGDLLVTEERVVRALFERSPVRLVFHSESERLIQDAKAAYRGKDWQDLTDLHARVRPPEACIESTSWLLTLSRAYEVPVHLLHITTREEVELLRQAPPHLSAETCPPYLAWNAADFAHYQNLLKCNPAIKGPEHQEALWSGLVNGVFTTVGTDHAPHTYFEKCQAYWEAPSGIPAHPYLLPWLYTMGKERNIPIEKWVALMAWGPARLWNIQDRGFLREGYWADLVLFDPDGRTAVTDKALSLNKCGWHPLAGQTLRGRVTATWVNGHLTYDGFYFLGSPAGQAVAFG